ncbi:hypothetical protein [Nocardia colli]|uniref:hypothetical protein n=1 Tax=Nocardia colli TaxID=2545717 RepID=UPI0035E0DEF3
MTTTSAARDQKADQDPARYRVLARSVGAVVVGVVMLVAAFACLNRMPGWADRYGGIWVYLGFFVYMSIAGRVFWWGLDQLLDWLRGTDR